MPADCRLAFDQIHMLAGISKREGGMYSGYSSPYYNRIRIDGNSSSLERFVEADTLDCRAD